MRTNRTWTVAVLAGLGACVSLALMVVASLDFGDPVASIRGQLTREADAERKLAFAAWGARRAAAEPVAEATGAVLVWSPTNLLTLASWTSTDAVRSVPRTPPDLIAPLAVARAEAGRGDVAGARTTLDRGFAARAEVTPKSAPGEAAARLVALRWARSAGDREATLEHLEALELIPWSESRGRSPRLLGLLAAADTLEPRERLVRADVLGRALVRGDWIPGEPRDEFFVDESGPRLRLDDQFAALARLLDERLPLFEDDWLSEFQVDARSSAALAKVMGRDVERLPLGRWEFFGREVVPALEPGARLAVRRDASGVSVAMHTRRALEDALADATSGDGSPWRLVTGAVPPAPAEIFGAPIAFDGTGLSPRIAHSDPAARVEAESRRLRLIRGALVLLALLIGLSTWLAVRALRRASRLADLRSTFVASVSHDLRTPLASISNLAANLADGVVVGEHATREYNLAIQREAGRLGRLVNGLLDFARIDRGERPRVSPAEVESAAWLDQLEGTAAEHCRSHGIRLRSVRSGVPKTLRIDADSVHRAVLNLVENAARHSGSDDITLRTSVEDGRLSLQVEDQGEGIPAGLREDLFEPYACRGDTAGTGLGLTIVRSIAEAHGGGVRLLDAEGGRGLTARFEVPQGVGKTRGDVA